MAAPHDHLNDPRWEGLDSQSLPDRPAHPDPSKRTEFGTAESVPSHGIVGHLDAKHGLVSDKDLDSDLPDPGAKVRDQVLNNKIKSSPRVDVTNTDDKVKGS